MNIVVACGGVSEEREVSLNSGASIAEALKNAGHEVTLVDVTSPHTFVTGWSSYGAEGVLIALHGGWGEDGRFQTCLEAFGIPYTGSGPEACMLAMDKSVAKLIFSANRVRSPEGFVRNRESVGGNREAALLAEYEKLVVKPNSGGSSTHITIASNVEEVQAGLEKAWQEEDRALVEAYIPGREITVAVMEDGAGGTTALPIIEIRPKEGFYDYSHKYTPGYTEYLCPAPLPEALTKKIQSMAVTAHKSLGCRVYSRVDFRLTEGEDIYILEVNTAPGMTATSLVPKAAAASGLSFAEFLEKMVKTSFAIDRKF